MTETHTSDTFTTGFQLDDFDLHAQPIFVGLPVPGTEFKICDFETGALKPLGEEGEIRVRTPSSAPEGVLEQARSHRRGAGRWLAAHRRHRRARRTRLSALSRPPQGDAEGQGHERVPAGDRGGARSAPGGDRFGRDRSARSGARRSPGGFRRAAAGATATTSDLAAWCASRLAAYKQPELRIVDELPMTATGKVKKQDLKP
jgi:long-chain acyl-CoA synthetase